MVHILHVYEDKQVASAIKNVLQYFEKHEKQIALISLSEPFDLPRNDAVKDKLIIIWSNNCRYTQKRDLMIEFDIDIKFKLQKKRKILILNLKGDKDCFVKYLEKCKAEKISVTRLIADYLTIKNFTFCPEPLSEEDDFFKEIVGTENHPKDCEQYKRYLSNIMPDIVKR